MICYDDSQLYLGQYLKETENVLNSLLSKNNRTKARIITNLDLGFPHDVIRIAGGFATGAYVEWESNTPFIPVDTCVNVCSTSFIEIDNDIISKFNDDYFKEFNHKLEQGIYISNFHRGNHFISYLRNEKNGKLYLLLHSSANEFKNNYNGLYPVSGNWYFDNIKTYKYNTRYIRYIEGRDAELFYMISKNLIQFNEVRHNFISHVFLADYTKIKNITHYHHYGMPTSSSIVMGGHIVNNHEIAPVLSLPGEKIFLIKFNRALEKELNINDNSFLTPHGWGKRHKTLPKIILDIEKNVFTLDNESYKIEFGTSLRAHPNLELRDFQNDEKNRIDNFFSYLYQLYDCEIVDIFNQLASINKSGVIKW